MSLLVWTTTFASEIIQERSQRF